MKYLFLESRTQKQKKKKGSLIFLIFKASKNMWFIAMTMLKWKYLLQLNYFLWLQLVDLYWEKALYLSVFSLGPTKILNSGNSLNMQF